MILTNKIIQLTWIPKSIWHPETMGVSYCPLCSSVAEDSLHLCTGIRETARGFLLARRWHEDLWTQTTRHSRSIFCTSFEPWSQGIESGSPRWWRWASVYQLSHLGAERRLYITNKLPLLELRCLNWKFIHVCLGAKSEAESEWAQKEMKHRPKGITCST